MDVPAKELVHLNAIAMKTSRILTLVLTIVLALPMSAQKLFTLEDLNFGGKNAYKFRPQNRYLTWWGDKLMYLDAEEGGTMNDQGKKTPVFKLSELGRDWHSAYGAQYPYADQPLVLLKNKSERVLYDFQAKKVVWRQAVSPEEQNQHWNAESRALAFTRDHQLFVRDSEGNETQLTTDGSRDIVYGEAVHRNEFGIEEGLFWSPDGQRLAFYRMDQSMVTDYPQVNIDPRNAQMEPDKYPMAGMNAHVVTVGLYDLRTKQTIYLQTPPVSYDATALQQTCYFSNISFSPDSKHVYIFELNRDQNDCKLVSYDAQTGRYEYRLCRETSPKYVEPLHPIQFLPWDSNLFLLQSEKDGYNHLYLYNIKGECVRQITSGQWVVMDVLGFNTKQKAVIIASNERHPLQRNIYAVDIKSGSRTLLDNGEGVHRATLSASGQAFYDNYSAPTVPRIINLVRLQEKNSKLHALNSQLLAAPDPWEGYQQPIFESGSIKAADGQTNLYWRMVKPADFNPTKRYPTVVYVYGGPHAHNVDASWHWYSRTWETYMAQKGYICFILDNRGSENRGRDFEQATFRQLGQIEMQDQMLGVAFLKSLPYVDSDRLGVHGWSFGGFMTISLMTNYPDVFKVGVAGGPVIDWQWYEVMYGERYMDTPQQNPEGYAKTSLIAKAKNLKGKLQIIIGYNDPTCVPQHTLSFLKACVEAGTQPDLFVYPGEGHNMMGHASVHLHERITQYFEDYLK